MHLTLFFLVYAFIKMIGSYASMWKHANCVIDNMGTSRVICRTFLQYEYGKLKYKAPYLLYMCTCRPLFLHIYLYIEVTNFKTNTR